LSGLDPFRAGVGVGELGELFPSQIAEGRAKGSQQCGQGTKYRSLIVHLSCPTAIGPSAVRGRRVADQQAAALAANRAKPDARFGDRIRLLAEVLELVDLVEDDDGLRIAGDRRRRAGIAERQLEAVGQRDRRQLVVEPAPAQVLPQARRVLKERDDLLADVLAALLLVRKNDQDRTRIEIRQPARTFRIASEPPNWADFLIQISRTPRVAARTIRPTSAG
jgi:hypothetical protein